MKFLVVLIIQITACILVAGNDNNFLFNSDRFPENEATPTLGNGVIGFVVHSDAVFLNGVFNGARERSHRARIPNYANLQLETCDHRAGVQSQCSYQLDMRFGRFRTIYSDPALRYRVVHDVYPHRFWPNVIVNQFRLQRLDGQGVIQVRMQQIAGAQSADVTFDPAAQVDVNGELYLVQCGRTNELEDPLLQAVRTEVCVYYRDYPTVMELPSDRTAHEFVFFTGFGTDRTAVLNQLRVISPLNTERVQTSEMNRLWETWGITVSGSEELDRAIKASAFHIICNIPEDSTITNQPIGTSPSGLGRGGSPGQDFQGHTHWDQDLWILPVVTLLNPTATRAMLRYRAGRASAGAAANAADNGNEGWQYPWASAQTGREVSPSADAAELQHHVTADVAFATRLYLAATNDLAWLRAEGCQLAYQTAKFWMNRAVYNEETDKFDIRFVTGPDASHRNVSNNAFTNVVAAHNLFFGEFAGCMCRAALQLSQGDWELLTRTARSLQLPYDSTVDFHPQFEGFTQGTQVGQADAVLLIYPLQLPMKDITKQQNLRIYSQATPANTPAMTWPIIAIGWLDLDEPTLAATHLRRSYQPYLRPPFNVWNERPAGFGGASNFVTGAGGFLQAILNGYAGIRLQDSELTLKPRLPPGTTRLFIPRIHYMQSVFSLEILPDKFTISTDLANLTPLEFLVDNQGYEMCSFCVANK
ncbi:protein-glucosylgalactosylhydroxylysine glucosidase-like [Culex pipiens pallens]|uniref:protein-glucosylgalactosylhydroxylysine glucosidase-like n=1 Tax=Culex pipiens pallens TaxID=42434 RepID=UPI0022AA367C|nr:protein-glucosylgalactosylhydroxylysine glucosidase-like [Culex pipiens pallens]